MAKRLSGHVASVAVVSLALAAPAAAAPADLDPTFSGDGIEVTDIGASDNSAGVVLQADGKVLVAGASSNGTSAGTNVGVARYTAAGALDPSYAGDGTQTADFGAFESGAAIALQADGKAVVVGRSGSDFLVARYTSDGLPDTTFSGDGVVVTDVAGGGAADGANAVAIQPDGRIVVAGSASGSGFAIARYTSTGVLDTTFAGDGTASAFTGSANATGVAVQSDGKIVVAGNPTSPGGDFALARLEAAGTLDTSFSGDGLQTSDLGGFDQVGGLALQADGKAVVAGTTFNQAGGAAFDSDFALARYDVAGTLDPTFAGDGTTTTAFPAADPNRDLDSAVDVAIGADGAIVVVGSAGESDTGTGFNANLIGLARYDAAGALDPTFSDDGRQTTRIDTANQGDRGAGVAIQADARIVVAASTNVPLFNDRSDFAVLRYGTSTGGPDPDGPDTRAPVFDLIAKKQLKVKRTLKKLKVKASTDEACTAAVTGTIKVPTKKKSKKLKLKPKPASVALAPGTSKLKLKLSGKGKRLVKKALAGGKKPKAKIKATCVDAAGNGASDKQKVKVKAKRKRAG